jgi:hypothetical protein
MVIQFISIFFRLPKLVHPSAATSAPIPFKADQLLGVSFKIATC